MNCQECGAQLCSDPRRKTDKCRPCYQAWTKTPEGSAFRSAIAKRMHIKDPTLRLRIAAANRAGVTDERRAKMAVVARINRNWEKSTYENRLKWQRAGVLASAEKRLGWCPHELRDEYRRLVDAKNFPPAEAREIILAQHEKNMADFRRKLGAA